MYDPVERDLAQYEHSLERQWDESGAGENKQEEMLEERIDDDEWFMESIYENPEFSNKQDELRAAFRKAYHSTVDEHYIELGKLVAKAMLKVLEPDYYDALKQLEKEADDY